MGKLEDFGEWKIVLVAEIFPSCANFPGYNILYPLNNSPLFLEYLEHLSFSYHGYASHSRFIVKISAFHTCRWVSLFRNASYLPVKYLDWMQDKNYPVPSEHAGRDYHLKATIAIYLHLQTRSPIHVLTMSLTVHICYKNFVLHAEEINCIIIFVWLLLFDHWPLQRVFSLSPLTENAIFHLSGLVPFSLWWCHSSEKDHSYYRLLY